MYLCVSARMHASAHLVHLFIQALCLFTDGKKAAVGRCIIMSSHINLLWVKQIFVHLVFFFFTAGVFHEISLKARTSFVRVLNLIDFLLALTLFLLFCLSFLLKPVMHH